MDSWKIGDGASVEQISDVSSSIKNHKRGSNEKG